MKRRIELVVFDLDGTLGDTVPDITACVKEFLHKNYGDYPVTDEIVVARIGNGEPKLMERIMKLYGIVSRDFEADMVEYKAMYREGRCEHTKLYPNVRKVLETLKEKGIKMAMATMKPKEATATFVDIFDIRKYMDLIISQEEMKAPKPDGWVVRECASRLGVDVKNVMMVGDNTTDVGAGLDAGALSVGVLGGYCKEEVLRNSGADIIVDDIGEILRYLEVDD